NALLNHKRFSELLDENNHIIKAWDTLHSGVPAYGEIITSRMRQEDPGLLDGARYIFKVAKSLGVQVFDRMVHGDSAFEVLSVDDIALPGVLRIQLGADVRGE
ncbi:MAG: hypothetical protein N2376_07395, partial [Clostridia bacterium]|nr:hypothetical protein [Clostridia bacterium]